MVDRLLVNLSIQTVEVTYGYPYVYLWDCPYLCR